MAKLPTLQAKTGRALSHGLAALQGGATCIHAMGRVSQMYLRNVQVDGWCKSMCKVRTLRLLMLDLSSNWKASHS